jgi:dihydrofolate reductase
MLKCSVYMAQSVDGYIAKTDGDIEWLSQFDDSGGMEDYGYHEFLDTVDVIVMGRRTYEKVLSFLMWPYEDKHVVVLSNIPLEVPDDLANKVTQINGTPGEVVARLSEAGAKHVYVDGGQTASSFVAAGLIDQLTITTVPLILGQGRPLFVSLQEEIVLEHIETKTFSNGLVKSSYRIAREDAP